MNSLRNILSTLVDNPLSVMRFLLSLGVGKLLYQQMGLIRSISDYSPEALSKTWILNLFPDTFLYFDAEAAQVYTVLILGTAILGAFGILGRLNLAILAFLGFIIMGVRDGQGIFDHHLSLSTQVLLILALVPGSMQLSVDHRIWKRWKKSGAEVRPNTSSARWGFNLILLLLVLTYFTAGVSKIRYGGMEWFDGKTLGFYLTNHMSRYEEGQKQLLIGSTDLSAENYWKDSYGFIGHTYGNYQAPGFFKGITTWVASNRSFVIFLSVGSVLIELLGFVVFFNSRYRNLYLISAILMHTSIGFLMELYFNHYRLIALCLIDWRSLLGNFAYKYGLLNKPA